MDSSRLFRRKRSAAPAPGSSDKERQRLRNRIEQLRKQHEWGDLSDAEYRKGRAAVEAALSAIPGDDDKLVVFNKHRRVVVSLGDTLAVATPEEVQPIVALLVDRVETRYRRVVRVVWTGAARPFFSADAALLMVPPDGLEPPTQALGRPRSVH